MLAYYTITNCTVTSNCNLETPSFEGPVTIKLFPNPATEWTILVITKICYYLLWIVLPLLVLDIAWWKVLIGFFVMHYTAGMILSVVFQLAHVVPKTDN